MTFEDYREYLASAFPKAVRKGIHSDDPHASPPEEIMRHAWERHEEWGFGCVADCFAEATPKSDRLSLSAWSDAVVTIDHWHMRVLCKSLHIMPNGAHIEIHNTGPQPPPFTATAYRSYFVPLPSFRDNKTVKDFINAQLPKTTQLSLL